MLAILGLVLGFHTNLFVNTSNDVLSGVVLDAVGRPIANVDVGTDLMFRDGKLVNTSVSKTNEHGEFSLKYQRELKWPYRISAVSRDGNWAASVDIDHEKWQLPIAIRLEPVCEVEVEVYSEDADFEVKSAYQILFADGKNGTVVVSTYGPSKRKFRFPSGSWILVLSAGSDFIDKRIAIDSKNLPVDPLRVGLQLSSLRKMSGKPAEPLTFSEARGVRKSFKLSDLKGKWVILEFWGFW